MKDSDKNICVSLIDPSKIRNKTKLQMEIQYSYNLLGKV